MSNNQKDVLWTNDITALIKTWAVFPTDDMSLEAKMNAITRFVILISFLSTFLTSFSTALIIFTIGILLVVTVYAASPPCEESFTTFPSTSTRFCGDAVPITPNDPDYESNNQKLVGDANPKTTIPPIVAAPSHDLTTWKENGMVHHSALNQQSNFDLERSGYFNSTPMKCQTCMYVPCMCHTPSALARRTHRQDTTTPTGTITTPPCNNELNDDLLTQTIQPGVYQKSYVGEPIQSNIGISFTQPFTHMEVEDSGNEIKFTQYAEKKHNQDENRDPMIQQQSSSNVYDPRFSGYGSSDRHYIDEMTGQPRFFYKDVEAVTNPNYIVRSKVDVYPWADTYGPEKDTPMKDVRTLANDAFLNASIEFRTDLQQRWMRKRNAELWQQRLFPISKQQQL